MLVTSLSAFEAIKEADKAEKLAALEAEETPGELAKLGLFEIGQVVEHGHVIGIGVYANGSPPSYLVRYRAADGRQTEQYHSEDALVEYPEDDEAAEEQAD